MCHEDYTTDDQVAAGRGPGGPAPGARSPARVLVEVLPEGLHPAPVVCPAGREDLLQDRLPRPRPAPGGLRRTPRGAGAGQGPPLLHAVQGRTTAFKKGEFVLLLFQSSV